jgi:hypothetical protein
MEITLTARQLRDALDFANPDGPEDLAQMDTEVTIVQREAWVSGEGEKMLAGLYAYITDYPEEGVCGPLGQVTAEI